MARLDFTSPAELPALADYARAVIREDLGGPKAHAPDIASFHQPAAIFVTVRRGDELQGCVGNLEPKRTALVETALHARAAAFHDPRGIRLGLEDVPGLSVEISWLGPLTPLSFGDEAQALAQLRPGLDGVVFEWRDHRATFLPQVWESLPEVPIFMGELKRKAGLPAGFWHPEVRLSTYRMTKAISPAVEAA
ncbi:MAG: AmmeMemoRadiSam system protein A [Myxococcota bacterium]